jgi:hypothetical protein
MARKAKQPRNGIIYRGPSLLDGAPIIVVATYTGRNKKTGLVVQTYILREDMSPLLASKSGADYSICGNCPMRGEPTNEPKRKQAKKRKCYVVLGQGPLLVYKAYHRGSYPVAIGHKPTAAIGTGRVVRLGTYGDPAVVPSYVWESLLSGCSRHMAYSHQSEVSGADFRPELMMLSADNAEQAKAAWLAGYRTFRVLSRGESPIAGMEIDCPSLRGVHCADCGLCGGASVKAKSITIPAHGAGMTHFS